MLSWALVSVITSAPVLLHVEISDNMTDDDTLDLALAMAAAVTRVTGDAAEVDPRPDPSGGCDVGCVRALAERHGAREVVLLRFYGAITSIGVFAARGDDPANRRRVDLERERGTWPDVLESIARALFPEPPAPPQPPPHLEPPVEAPPPKAAVLVEPAPPPPEVPAAIGPYLLLAGGVAAATIGGGFYVAARGDIGDLEAELATAGAGKVKTLTFDEAHRRNDDAYLRQGVALGAAAAGVAAIAGAVLWWVLDDDGEVTARRVGS